MKKPAITPWSRRVSFPPGATAAYERARSRYTASYEVVPMPGGHFMHREHPAHFVRELLRVLEGERAR